MKYLRTTQSPLVLILISCLCNMTLLIHTYIVQLTQIGVWITTIKMVQGMNLINNIARTTRLPSTTASFRTFRHIHNTAAWRKPNSARADEKATSSWPEGSSSHPHTDYHPVEGREGKTARLIFRIKPSDIPTELLPLFAAVGLAVVGATGYGVYACKY